MNLIKRIGTIFGRYHKDIGAVSADPQNSIVRLSDAIDKALRAKYGDTFITDICKKDEMYQFLSNHPGIKNPTEEYFISGASMLNSLKDILVDLGYTFAQIDTTTETRTNARRVKGSKFSSFTLKDE